MTANPGTVAALFVALYAAHMVGDHWVQTDQQAGCKGMPGPIGRGACFRHVLTMTVTKVLFVGALIVATGMDVRALFLGLGLAVDAVSHYWADRRFTLAVLVARMPWLTEFWQLGKPRTGKDDNPSLGTGAYALDQSWHVAWLFVAALIGALGGAA